MLATYDARQVVAAGSYVAANPTEPRPAAQNYCGHCFETHPDRNNGGLVTMAGTSGARAS